MENTLYGLNGRVWLEKSGEKVLGRGRVELLERIKASGSIRQAALQMKMSYKQAWDMVNHINSSFDAPSVIVHRGGKGGGYAVVTEKGIELITRFQLLEQKLLEFLHQNEALLW